MSLGMGLKCFTLYAVPVRSADTSTLYISVLGLRKYINEILMTQVDI